MISAYAPTMTNPEEVKDQFYEQLDVPIAAVPKSEKLIILGDFNARVGTNHHTWSGVIGQPGTGKYNSNGILLLQTCTAHELVITNTLFRIPTRNKTTWMHPRSKDGMKVTVIDNGDTSDSFPVTNGVKQGCILAPTRFSMVFTAMLRDASQDNHDGIPSGDSKQTQR